MKISWFFGYIQMGDMVYLMLMANKRQNYHVLYLRTFSTCFFYHRGVLTTLSNIGDGSFFLKNVSGFQPSTISTKTSNSDV